MFDDIGRNFLMNPQNGLKVISKILGGNAICKGECLNRFTSGKCCVKDKEVLHFYISHLHWTYLWSCFHYWSSNSKFRKLDDHTVVCMSLPPSHRYALQLVLSRSVLAYKVLEIIWKSWKYLVIEGQFIVYDMLKCEKTMVGIYIGHSIQSILLVLSDVRSVAFGGIYSQESSHRFVVLATVLQELLYLGPLCSAKIVFSGNCFPVCHITD